MAFILVVDDDPFVREALSAMLRGLGHEARTAARLDSARGLLAREPFEAVFLDVHLPDGQGLSLMPEIRTGFQAAEVLVITATDDQAMGRAAILAGAFDYIEKPLTTASIGAPLAKALEYRRARLAQRLRPTLSAKDMIGASPAFLAACEQAAQAAQGDAPVLVSGESGTGKELLSRAIHRTSRRRDAGFVVVDCAALPESLLEGVLFGHAKGAFTGADRDREGLVLLANGGTLFLDEVGELPLSAQKGFLRVLQEKRFRPLGSKVEVASDFRLVAATNRDLAAMVRAGTFREDLYFRMQAERVHLPALRHRGEDAVLLAEHAARVLAANNGLPQKELSPDFRAALLAYAWPGNVRELRHAVERAVLSHQQAEVVFARDLPGEVRAAAWMAGRVGRPGQTAQAGALGERAMPRAPGQGLGPGERLASGREPDGPAPDREGRDPGLGLSSLPVWKDFRRQAVRQARREYVEELMRRSRGNMQRARELSGLSQSRLYDLVREGGEE